MMEVNINVYFMRKFPYNSKVSRAISAAETSGRREKIDSRHVDVERFGMLLLHSLNKLRSDSKANLETRLGSFSSEDISISYSLVRHIIASF